MRGCSTTRIFRKDRSGPCRSGSRTNARTSPTIAISGRGSSRLKKSLPAIRASYGTRRFINMKLLLKDVYSLPAGDYCECGVYQGDSAKVIVANMAPGSRLFLFDSFEGHPEPSELDMAEHH